MTWQYNPYAFPLLAGATAMLALTLITWRYKTHQSTRYFLITMLGVTGLMITYTGELFASSLPLILLWAKLEYVFSLSIPIVFLLFILSYNGYDAWLTRSHIIAMFLIPALQLVAVWTNDYFGLNWQTVGIKMIGSVALFDRTYGPMFWIGIGYVYFIVTLGTVVLILTALRSSTVHQRQLTPLVLSVIVVWIANVLTILHVSELDLTPFGYALMCCLIAWSLFRFKLFDIMPAAQGAVIRQMSDTVLVLDAQQRIIELNPAGERLLAQNAKQVIGQSVTAILSNMPELWNVDAESEVQREIAVTLNGERCHFDRQISPLCDDHGQLTGKVIVLRDISRLIRAEEATHRYAAEMKERNNELDAFSHTIAHDLKAPLTLIGGYAEIILMREKDGLSPRACAHLDAIHTASLKMTDMVNDLLLLSSTTNVEDLVAEVDMEGVARASLARFMGVIEQQKCQIDIMPDLPPALGYDLWIEEVFANLVGNALKYIGKSNPEPRITICGSLLDGMVRYEVRDNGLGIDPEDQTRLFNAFARFHKNEASGVGLGLTIVLRIVKRLNGQVGVESTPGKGSTFWFTLPMPVRHEGLEIFKTEEIALPGI